MEGTNDSSTLPLRHDKEVTVNPKDKLATGIKIDRSNNTATKIEEMIHEHKGQIPYSLFMKTCLFGEDGYYSKGKTELGGMQADFLTSPEKSNLFGATLGITAAKIWEGMDKPSDFKIVEMGAGSGALADGLLRWAKTENPAFYQSLRYTIVEYGGLIAKQKTKLQDEEKIQWIQGSASDLPLQTNSIEGMFISNELPDTFPMEITKRINGEIKQKYITLENDEWVEVWKDPSEKVKTYIEEYNLTINEDIEEPINPNAAKWQQEVGRALKRGAMVTIDYGKNGPVGSTERAMRVYPEGSEYKKLGKVDITADVNFDILGQIAQTDGLTPAFLGTETEFLLSSGINELVTPLLERINKTKSWNEILTISRQLAEYKTLLRLGQKNQAAFLAQVFTKDISVDFSSDNIQTLPLKTGVRIHVGKQNEEIIVQKTAMTNTTYSVNTNREGNISLDILRLLPHEIVDVWETDFILKDGKVIRFRNQDEKKEAYKQVIENSGYTYDIEQ